MISFHAVVIGFVCAVLGVTVVSSTITNCYTCNSVYDPNCEHSPSDSFKKPCVDPSKPYVNKTAVGCRKIKQEINDNPRIIRQCAFSGGEMKGVKRTGNKGVRVFYWQCLDGDNCNSAVVSRSSLLMAILLPLVTFLTLSHW